MSFIQGLNTLTDTISRFRLSGHVGIDVENAKQIFRAEFQRVNLHNEIIFEKLLQISELKRKKGPGISIGSGSGSDGSFSPIGAIAGVLVVVGIVACVLLCCYIRKRNAQKRQQNSEEEPHSENTHAQGYNNNAQTVVHMGQGGNVPAMPTMLPQQQGSYAQSYAIHSGQGHTDVPPPPPPENLPLQQQQLFAEHQHYNLWHQNEETSTPQHNYAVPLPPSQSNANSKVPALTSIPQTAVQHGVPPTMTQQNKYEAKQVQHGVPPPDQHQPRLLMLPQNETETTMLPEFMKANGSQGNVNPSTKQQNTGSKNVQHGVPPIPYLPNSIQMSGHHEVPPMTAQNQLNYNIHHKPFPISNPQILSIKPIQHGVPPMKP